MFENASTPFLHETPSPWIGLLVFTEDELTPSETQLGAITKAFPGTTLQRTSTMAYQMTMQDMLTKLDPPNIVQHQVSTTDENKQDKSMLSLIFIPHVLFSGIFASYETNDITHDIGISTPSLAKFDFLSHVRNFDSLGQANADGAGSTQCAVTLSPRLGPMELETPITVYAHLISLIGIRENMVVQPIDRSKPAALVSLYSWSYTCNPSDRSSMATVFKSLGNTIQPLRPLDSSISILKNPSIPTDDWVRSRLSLGYNLVRHRLETGEVSLAIQRGFLTPTSPRSIDFPPSDFGSDLAIVDEKTGILDITFQLAWELGRTAAMADRVIAGALMRLRAEAHQDALSQSKQTRYTEFLPAKDTVSQQGASVSNLRDRITALASTNNFFADRWQRSALQTSLKTQLSFRNEHTQAQYIQTLQPGLLNFANATTSSGTDPYNKINVPISSDYATVLKWCRCHVLFPCFLDPGCFLWNR